MKGLGPHENMQVNSLSWSDFLEEKKQLTDRQKCDQFKLSALSKYLIIQNEIGSETTYVCKLDSFYYSYFNTLISGVYVEFN